MIISAEGGTRPVRRVESLLPNCPDPVYQCAWGYSQGLYFLKFINMGCRLHVREPHATATHSRRPAQYTTRNAKNKR